MRLVDRGIALLACTVLVCLLLVVLAGVLTRAADDPLIWTDEGARFLMVWLACLGWMIAGRRRAHVRVRFFQDLLPPRPRHLTEVAIQSALAVLGLAVAGYGVALVRRNAGLEATSLPLSMAWLYVPIVPAGLVMAMQSVAQVLERPTDRPV